MNLSEFVTEVASDIRTLLKLRDKLKGGAAGQTPKKNGPDDFDFSWADAGGGAALLLTSDNCTYYDEDGNQQQGALQSNITSLVIDPAFPVEFDYPNNEGATIRAPVPADSFSFVSEGGTINAATFGYSHVLVSTNSGVTARYTLDANYTGFGKPWRKTLFNGHDAPVEVVITNAFTGVVARIVGNDGSTPTPLPMLTIPVGGVLTVVPNPINFKLYAWGDLS